MTRCLSCGGKRVVLFPIGAGTSLFTGRSILFSGFRQLAIGYAAAGTTIGIGHFLGVTFAG
jgi:VIT1/CCC1 family predicted Fe2+/Mn2+ transporter